MMRTGLLLFLLIPLNGLAGFHGENCEPEDESFLLQSSERITNDSKASQISFVRSEENGDETEVVLEEGRDYKLKIAATKNEAGGRHSEQCADGRQATHSSGTSDKDLIFIFKDETQLSKELKKLIKEGKAKVSVSCQWSAVENPCSENE